MTDRGCALALLSLVAAMALFFFGAAILGMGVTGLLGWNDLGSTSQHVQMTAVGLVGVGGAAAIVAWLNRLGAREEDERRARMPVEAAPREDVELARWTMRPEEWRAFTAAEMRRARREAAVTAAAMFAIAMTFFGGFWGEWAIGLAVSAVCAALGASRHLTTARRAHAEGGRGDVVIRRSSIEINGIAHLLEDGRWWLAGTRFLPGESPAVLELVTRRESHGRHGPRTMENVIRVPVARGSEDEARRLAGDLRRPLPPGENPKEP